VLLYEDNLRKAGASEGEGFCGRSQTEQKVRIKYEAGISVAAKT